MPTPCSNACGHALWACDIVCIAGDGRTLLKNVTFVAQPGEVTAILGPSGAGKTTLLNTLLLRVPRHYFKHGAISYKRSKAAPRVGYVMANDALLPYLTVRETLIQAAQLRLSDLSHEEQSERISLVLHQTQLAGCVDSLVGEANKHRSGTRTISKGERKRLSIAIELLGSPAILCLDEPTTGIDSRLALEVVITLKNLARNANLTVVLTVHQPGEKIVSLFDKLTLLADASILYNGSPDDVRRYFMENCGLEIPTDISTADFLLEIATLDRGAAQSVASARQFVHTSTHSRLETLKKLYLNSPMQEATMRQVLLLSRQHPSASPPNRGKRAASDSEAAEPSTGGVSSITTSTSVEPLDLGSQHTYPTWWIQLRVALKRAWLSRLREKKSLFWIVAGSVFQALIFGCLFYHIASDVDQVSTPPVDQWPIWDSPPLHFLMDGLNPIGSTSSPTLRNPLRLLRGLFQAPIPSDSARANPLADLLIEGVNVEDQSSSIVLDVIDNWSPLSRYAMDVTTCLRILLDAPQEKEYPQWQYGEAAAWLHMGRDNITDWSLSPPRLEDMTLEQMVSGIVAGAQVLDTILAHNFDMPHIEETQASMFRYWLPLALKGNWLASPLLCCLGDENVFTLMRPRIPKTCEITYRDKIKAFPVFPYQHLSRYYQDRREFTHERQAMKSGDHSPSPKVPLMQVERATWGSSSRRRIGEVQVQKRRLTRSGSEDLILLPSRRTSQKGVGSMVEDIVDKIVWENKELMPIIEQLRKIGQRVRNCDLTLCRILAEGSEVVELYLGDTVTSIMSVLNVSGVLIFLFITLGFLTHDVLNLQTKYRVILNRERHLKIMSASPYLLGHMIVDQIIQIPLALAWSAVFLGLVMGGQTNFYAADIITRFASVVILFSFAAYSVAYAVGVSARDSGSAAVINTMIAAFMLVFTGMFLPDSRLPSWIAWAKGFSIYRHALRAGVLALFPSSNHFGSLPNNVVHALFGVPPNLQLRDCLWILFGLSVLYRFLALVILTRAYKSIGLQT